MNTLRIRVLVALGLLVTSAVTLAQAPDISGNWQRDPDPNAGGVDYPPPPGGPPPFKEPYASTYKAFTHKRDAANQQGKQLAEDPSARCIPEGMPTLMGGTYDLEVLQVKHEVVVLAEFLTQTRRIYLDETLPSLEDISPSYAGYSVGHWEGNVLVVYTVGVRENVQFMNMPHSKKMRITERIRLVPTDRLEDRVTLADPEVFTRPYTFTFGYKRDQGYRILENICDNNRYGADAHGEMTLKVTP